MQRIGDRFVYAASDLNDYVQCKRLAELDVLVAGHRIEPPTDGDPQAELIRRKGDEHELHYLNELERGAGHESIVRFGRSENSIESFIEAERRTHEAMATGVPFIYQATFFDGTFLGRADFLRRVESPSTLGNWSYEVLDTKLALNPKPYFLVQLCNYSEHLERLQGTMPEHGHIVLGDGTQTHYRMHDYMAYYRRLRRRFLAFVSEPARAVADAPATYPHRCGHCGVCAWNDACIAKRLADDHLSLVAWMRRNQIEKLEAAGITTLGDLAHAAGDARPIGMSEETFAKLCRQANLQWRGRHSGEPIYELVRHAAPLGFTLLPQPSSGDVFFDMEGDPLFEPARSLEYLFGCWMPNDTPTYRAFWALDRAQEKRAFEDFVDFVAARRKTHPSLHVYHYAPYEKVALRRLAQAHCTREEELDELLRSEVFVDLYAVVRQALVISEDGYGLKKLERFYGLIRNTDVKKGDESIVEFERWLQNKQDTMILEGIEAYNRDDCRSTYMLAQWLLDRRSEAIAQFASDLPFRPLKAPNEPCHAEFIDGCVRCQTRRNEEREEQRRTGMERELLAGIVVPQTDDEYLAMAQPQRARYLLANLLAYHRREEKPGWWAYFDRCENIDELREFDRDAIGELTLRTDITPYRASARDRNLTFIFGFPEQNHKLGKDTPVHDPFNRRLRKIVELIETADERRVALKLSGIEEARTIAALIPAPPVPTAEQRKALLRIAQAFIAGTLDARYPAAFDLLNAADPRMRARASGANIQPAEVSARTVSRVVRALDRSCLFIQGPPGSGKTTISAEVICDLLQAGKRVGVTSTGHKAIHHLLHKIEKEMQRRGTSFRGLYKHSDSAGSSFQSKLDLPFVASTGDNKDFDGFSLDLAAGTGWLFARESLVNAFDYLFIDEAGQVSLADALAVCASARNVVLVGDPSQLAQVSQGVHPLHAGDSVLQHILGVAETVPPHRGIFLDRSYRMQPEICSFISDAMYQGRLKPDPATQTHRLQVDGEALCGLRYLPVEHAGNASQSSQECTAIVQEVTRLLAGRVSDSNTPLFSDRPMEPHDIIVVTPYNAQRRLLTQAFEQAELPIEVGTVDKFQGREAAVVFYSMATSSGDDAPRDLSFLFERNRFNVAVSRARALSILVCSPNLLDVACTTTEQMALANLLCSFVERANGSAGNAVPASQYAGA